ncbi:MAG: ABC transporter permease [Burkholderiales bacterium]|nr:ABC transporter permease [Burkholderiales bacterium]
MSAVASQPGPAPELRQIHGPDGTPRIELSGAWNLRSLEARLPDLAQRLQSCARDVHWDLGAVVALDRAGAMLLWRTWGRRRLDRLTLRPEHETLFSHLTVPQQAPPPAVHRDWKTPFAYLGGRMLQLADHLFGLLLLLGRVTLDCVTLVRHPGRVPWREISAGIYRTGTQALGITALVGFLVGVVLSYLSAQQLRQFGADIFIINLLGVSVIRELGPVLAAILVAGRSGSAMTAQLGVMRVTEELDAMAVMGIPHTLRLVLPKVIALAIAMPLVILWTDTVALFGGMLAAQSQLGIGVQFFLSSLPDAVPIANLWLGLGKGVVFGILIALVACHFGLRIEPNTESLGAGTTNSVVSAITVVIIVDAVFAVLFSDVGSF